VNKRMRKGGLRRVRWDLLLRNLVPLQRNVVTCIQENMGQYPLKRSVVLERVLRRGTHRWGSVSSIKRRPHGRNMEVTDSHWSRMVHRGPLIGHVDVVWILHSTWPINPGHDWLKYIPSMVFRLMLAGGGSGWGLEKDTRQMSTCKRQRDRMSKLTQVCSASSCGWCGA
jgi:hypothetical protein